MPVFISYRHTDRVAAMEINRLLQSSNITTYLDVMDAESRTTDDITTVIGEHITACTHLIALVSNDTALSWWVPFEIGEATITERRIATYQIGSSELPIYLDKWPIMKKPDDIKLFIAEYKADSLAYSAERSMGMEDFFGSASAGRNADSFHANLKRKIRLGV